MLQTFEPEIESVTLIPSDSGRFEVNINGRLVYSKMETGRHIEPADLNKLVKQYLEDGNR